MFVKKFPGLTAEQIALLARHAREVAAALAATPEASCPAVLAVDAHSISYEVADCSLPLAAQLRAGACTLETMHKAGGILRAIHQVPSLMHADYVAHNICISGDKLVIIDPHPPGYLPFDETSLYGHQPSEIARFVFAQLANTGFKRVLLQLGQQVRLTKAFLQGYGQPSPSFSQLLPDIWKFSRESFQMKRLTSHSLAHSLRHAAAGYLLSLFVLRLAL